MAPTLVWFRQDLRLADNAALAAALKRGGPVIPVFVLDEPAEGHWKPGAASRWWLHHSLAALDAALRVRGGRLVLARGDAAAELPRLAQRTGADAVYWNHRYEPAAVRQETNVRAALSARGIEAAGFSGALLFSPAEVRNRQGAPFQVFTPFWRHCLGLAVPPPVASARRHLPACEQWPESLTLEAFALLPRVRWDGGLASEWQPGEAGAARRLRRFIAGGMDEYAAQRDFPASDGTSQLSPHLHFGELSPRQVWAAVAAAGEDSGAFPPGKGAAVFLNEIGWREFSYHLLIHFPHTPEDPLRPAFARFPWARDPGDRRWAAWTQGRTGYPLVDAGLRQLGRTGWMHNRVRMIVASFLVKHLRLPWQRGAAWFWDTLVDADLASNTMGWQWTAGCGADAAPYFRIFAPVAQGAKFDPAGAYVRRWVPELARLPAKHVHAPWLAPASVLAAAGAGDYPAPIVDHATARAEALAAFQSLPRSTPS